MQRNGAASLQLPGAVARVRPRRRRRTPSGVAPGSGSTCADAEPGASVPGWVEKDADGFTGTIARRPSGAPASPSSSCARCVRPAAAEAPFGWVVVDMPVDGDDAEPAVRARPASRPATSASCHRTRIRRATSRVSAPASSARGLVAVRPDGQPASNLRLATATASGDGGAHVPVRRALRAPVGRAVDRGSRRPDARGRCAPQRRRRRRGAVPDHPARRAGDGPGARALDHELGPRAVHGHRAGPAGGLHAPHQDLTRRISSASWRARSTR